MGHGIDKKKVALILNILAVIIVILGLILTNLCGLDRYLEIVGCILACLLYIIVSVIDDKKHKKFRITFCVLMMLYGMYILYWEYRGHPIWISK